METVNQIQVWIQVKANKFLTKQNRKIIMGINLATLISSIFGGNIILIMCFSHIPLTFVQLKVN